MRRLFCIATFVLALAAIPALAQRGGGHGFGGGGHAAFGGHSGGFGGHAVGGAHSGVSFAGRSIAHAPAVHSQNFRGQNFHQPFPSRGFRHSNGVRIRTFRNCFGCRRLGYPLGYAGYYDPWWWWDSGSSYDEDRAREIELANEMNQQSLAEQQARHEGDQDVYADARSMPRNDSISAEAPAAATVLVFRDQHKQEVQNYAIVGDTLWAFAPQRTQKIAMADLDLPATQKANEDRGVEFRVPGSGEGQ